MTLTGYIKILKANLLFILIICTVSAIAAYFSTNLLKSGFVDQRTFFLTINDTAVQDKNNLDTVGITDTIVAVLASPNLINSQSSRSISIGAKKQAQQIIELTVTSNDPQLSSRTSSQIIDSFNSKINQYVPGHNLQLAQISQDYTPAQRILNSKVLALSGAIFGFLLSALLILIARYLKV